MDEDEFRQEIFKIVYWFEENGDADDLPEMLIDLANKITKSNLAKLGNH
jgi:uncharacterized protein YggL (DUF469 family)